MGTLKTDLIHKKIGLFVNPLAGKGRSLTVALQIAKILRQKSIDFEVYDSEWPETFNGLSETWIVGGDGTLNYFLNKFPRISIPIAIYKGGTGNDFAWKLYGNVNLQQQIEHVLGNNAKVVDAAECNGKIFINGIGIGFDGEVLRSIKTIRFLGGYFGYLFAVLKSIYSFKEYKYEIIFNDRSYSEKFLLVIITNSSRCGGGFMVSPNADITDGELNMVLCKPLSVFKRLKNLPLIKKGNHLHKKFIFHTKVSTVKILCEQVTFGHLDGELIIGTSFEINVTPQRYLFKY